jgi:hypothetical protein
VLFGYPIAATAENWLHECLLEMMQTIHANHANHDGSQVALDLPFYQFRRPSVAVSPYSVNLVDFFDSFSVRLL